MPQSKDIYHYAPITNTVEAAWPNGKKLAVYFVMGVEAYKFGEGITEDLIPGTPAPDYTNTSWRDYGNRVGAFRIQQRFNEFDMPLSVLLNTNVYDEAPQLMSYLRVNGSEIIAHGLSNSDTLSGRQRENEKSYLAAVKERIDQQEQQTVLGWSSPWLSHTENTLDLLCEQGYNYVLDFCLDDRPVQLKTQHGSLLHIPYGLELNDSSTIIGRQASATEFTDMIIDQFDELLLASETQPLVMSVVIHSFISGQPFRLRQLTRALKHIAGKSNDVWITTPNQIYKSVVDNSDLAV